MPLQTKVLSKEGLKLSKEEARTLLDGFDFFRQDPNAKEWKGMKRGRFLETILILTEEEDLASAYAYLESLTYGLIEGTLPTREVIEKAGEEKQKPKTSRERFDNSVKTWIKRIQQGESQVELDEAITDIGYEEQRLGTVIEGKPLIEEPKREVYKAPEEKIEVKIEKEEPVAPAPIGVGRPTLVPAPKPAQPSTPKAAPSIYLVIKKPTSPLTLQTAIRKSSLKVASLPFDVTYELGKHALYQESPQKMTAYELASHGVTEKKLEARKTEALAAGFDETSWNSFIKALEEVRANTKFRATFGRATEEDVGEIIFASRESAVSPTLVRQFLLTSSPDGGEIVMSESSFIGGIVSQIGQGILGRPAAGLLKNIFGIGVEKAAEGAAATAATTAAKAATGVVSTAVGIGAKKGLAALIGGLIGNIPGFIVGLIATQIPSFIRNKGRLLGYASLAIGALATALGLAIVGVPLMGLGALSILGSAAGGLAGAGASVGTFTGSILYGITHVVVPSIAAPLAIAMVTIPVLVAFILFVINNSAFVTPGTLSSQGIIPSGGVIPPVAGACKVATSGLCSLNDPLTDLQGTFGDYASNASQICLGESGGRQEAINDGCIAQRVYNRRGWSAEYSVGLYQINLVKHPHPLFIENTPEGQQLERDILSKYGVGSCYNAFSNYQDVNPRSGVICEIGNEALFKECVTWFQNPSNNVAYAKFVSKGGTNWSSDWINTSKKCNIK